mgnify:FL=1
MVTLQVKQDRTLRHVNGSRATIGRSSEADIQLKVASDISRIHCAIEGDSGTRWVVEDYSRNGTFVNGLRVRGRAYVRNGDELRLGNQLQIVFKISVEDRPAVQRPPAYYQMQSDIEPRSVAIVDTRSETEIANRVSVEFADAARRSLAHALTQRTRNNDRYA